MTHTVSDTCTERRRPQLLRHGDIVTDNYWTRLWAATYLCDTWEISIYSSHYNINHIKRLTINVNFRVYDVVRGYSERMEVNIPHILDAKNRPSSLSCFGPRWYFKYIASHFSGLGESRIWFPEEEHRISLKMCSLQIDHHCRRLTSDGDVVLTRFVLDEQLPLLRLSEYKCMLQHSYILSGMVQKG